MSATPRVAAESGLATRIAAGFVGLAGLTYCLIVLGALVRAHDAGLACPDWPLCKGEVVPEFDVKVAFEWSHRALAGAVSLGLLAFSWWGWRRAELRVVLKPRLLLVWLLLLAQVTFGGLTVLLGLAPWTVSGHLLLGNCFCLCLLWISRDLYEIRSGVRERVSLAMAVPTLVAVSGGCLVLQIVLGGLVSSHYAGLACTTFPTCNGDEIVPTLAGLRGLHVLHRLNGFALLASFGLLAGAARHTGRLGWLAGVGLRLTLLQIVVGIANVMLRLPFAVTALHTAIAAALVLTVGLLVREMMLVRGTHSVAPHMMEA